MSVKAFIISVPLVLAASAASAQASKDTVIKGATIEIIQSYKPQVTQAPKPEFTPSLPPVDTSRPNFRYDVPQQTLNYTYSSLPLRPLALGLDSIEIPYANYAKIGAGNLGTIYLDAGIGSLRGDNYTSAIHLHHLSQKGDISDQKVSLTGLDADGQLTANGYVWHAGLSVNRRVFNYYGYNHDLLSPPEDSVNQAFTGVDVTVDMRNEETGLSGISYHPSVSLSLYSDKFDASETSFGFDVPFTKSFDTALHVQLGLRGNITSFNGGLGSSQQNNIFQLTPAVRFNVSNLHGKAGLYPTLGQNSTVYLLPDIHANFRVPRSQFSFFAGWEALLRQNTYEELSTINPYIFNSFAVMQSRTDEVFGGIQGNLGDHISFNGRVSWWEFSTLPLFVNNIGDGKQFDIIYSGKFNALSFKGALRYQLGKTFGVGLDGAFYNFYNHTVSKIWHTPAIQLKADVMLRLFPELYITGYVSVWDELYGLNTAGNNVKLSAVTDIGAGAEYNIIPRLGIFIQTNNLLNTKYQRWMGYPAFGFNIYGGVRLKF